MKKPMLAARKAKLYFPLYADVKYDGIRMLVEKRGDVVRLQTRKGFELTGMLPQIERELAKLDFDFTLDGELYSPGGTCSETLHDISANAWKLTYVVFDLLDACGMNLVGNMFILRREILKKMVPVGERVKLVMGKRIGNRIELNELFGCVKGLGFEGLVMKRLNGEYLEGVRSSVWGKMK